MGNVFHTLNILLNTSNVFLRKGQTKSETLNTKKNDLVIIQEMTIFFILYVFLRGRVSFRSYLILQKKEKIGIEKNRNKPASKHM